MPLSPASSRSTGALPGKAGDQTFVSGAQTTLAVLTNQKAYAASLYVPAGLSISKLRCRVTTPGEAGSLIRLGVYDDDYGWPSTLLVDAGTVTGDSIAYKAITGLSVFPQSGTGYVWLVGCIQAAPTTPPTIARMVGSGTSLFRSVLQDAAAFLDTGTYGYPSIAGVTGALPSTWTGTRGLSVETSCPAILATFA